MNIFPTLANFNTWVNNHIYDAVATLSDADYRKDCGVFFGSVHNTLNHLLVVDRLWFARVQGERADISSLDQVLFDDFGGLLEGRAAEDKRIIDLVSSFSEDALSERVSFQMTNGDPAEMIRANMLMSVFNHQTHHRGQITAMLSTFGVEYADIDLPYYLRTV